MVEVLIFVKPTLQFLLLKKWKETKSNWKGLRILNNRNMPILKEMGETLKAHLLRALPHPRPCLLSGRPGSN